MDNKTLWISDTDINGLDTVAKISKMDDNYFLEVVSKKQNLRTRLKMAWRLLTGKMTTFSFLIFTDEDKWVRGFERGRKDSKGK